MEVNILAKKKIVILGAGYAGLTTIVRLQKLLGANEADIVLVNKNDYHYETTWLHEASAGTIDPNRVCYQIDNIIDSNKVQFVQDTVVEIDKENKKVILENGELTYDYLVIGIGAVPETFGIQGLAEHAFTITNMHTAGKIREHIEEQFAIYSKEAEPKAERLTFVVGGAGFTGVEFLGELVQRVPELCKKYNVNIQNVKIICVEAAPTVLPGFDKDLVDYAVSKLEKKGVEFKIQTAITECTPEGILVKKGDEIEEIKSLTVIWAAGVRGNPIVENMGIETMRGRVKVNLDLRVPGEENIFIIGDGSLMIDEAVNRPYPPTAQIAMQQAVTCAKNITALVRDQGQLENFKADIKGMVCSLGHNDAIGLVFGKRLKGTPAAFMKKVIDNRSLFIVGGPGLVMKKGKFKFL
ncbi:NAD(P)/FAD-dependent oxidoreductase [Bacillus massiliigorillae]|uniref:NAD(P)/FAD-dependent oxidoreductase n=1 Tax=Bacillus massiliigorillae TaxID=1243664 RepID=UPI0003A43B34|nr:NAD(P)/FAD-dependent oxidoreductase [Bacillus massiliigorillae]